MRGGRLGKTPRRAPARWPALLLVLGAVGAPGAAARVRSDASSLHATARVTSVVFRGSASKPLVIIHGENLGARPVASPARGVSNFGLCGPIATPAGFDFGGALWLEDETQRWSGGYSRYVDCIGLILVTYTPTEIALKFGTWYHVHFGTRTRVARGVYGLYGGDVVNLKVRGVTITATVHYQRLTRPISPAR